MNKSVLMSVLKMILSAQLGLVGICSMAAEMPSVQAKAPQTKVSAPKEGNTEMVKDGVIEFFVLGRPSMLKIHGESHVMTGEFNRIGKELTGELKIPLNSFVTGMTTRDNHLKEKVFETSKYETALLRISALSLPTETGVFKDLPFTGKLNLHGVDKEVTGTSSVTTTQDSTDFVAHVEIKLTDYGITPPEFMGMSIQDNVKIDAKGIAKSAL